MARYGLYHYIDVIMTTMASQITSLTIVYSTVYLGYELSDRSDICQTGSVAAKAPVKFQNDAEFFKAYLVVQGLARSHDKTSHHSCHMESWFFTETKSALHILVVIISGDNSKNRALNIWDALDICFTDREHSMNRF